MTYMVDEFGRLWKGPFPSDSNFFHYAVFQGVGAHNEAIWVEERSSPPESAYVITTERAENIIDLYRKEMDERRSRA